jgi:DNA segregation ATPase FtsK/SpoIIIE, S-DNA-T family
VTDLDNDMARRALRGLEAELLRREQFLRDAGVSDIAAYTARRAHRSGQVPLPRLLIVVDEFATLVHELPEFVDALIDVAQRGRSLGVHLLLATQRPAGAVKDAIRTNTNLRIALRVLDIADSRDVIGSDAAAHLPRSRPGRALARLGLGETREFQSAYLSATTGVGPPTALQVRRLDEDPRDLAAPRPPCDAAPDGELELLVRSIVSAHTTSGHARPRRLWSEPLPNEVDAGALNAFVVDDDALAFAVSDDARHVSHGAASWCPEAGNLLVAGLAGSGTTTTLRSLVLATARQPEFCRPDLYIIATTTAPYDSFASWAHVGAVIAVDDDERVRRLLALLHTVKAERRQCVERARPIVVMIDGIGALRAAYDSVIGLEVLDQLERLCTEGPPVRIHVAMAAEHPAAVGHRLDRCIARRVLLRLGDRGDYLPVGVRDVDPASWCAGRGIDSATGALLQVVFPTATDIEIAARALAAVAPLRRAVPVGWLPASVSPNSLPHARWVGRRLHLPVGIGGDTLGVCELVLHPGEHAIVTGGPRSGKSVLLAALRDILDRSGIEVHCFGTARSPMRDSIVDRDAAIDRLQQLTARHAEHPVMVLVDDADAVDLGTMLDQIIATEPGIHVIAAARSDRLRGLFRHWTTDIRKGVTAVLLRAEEADGDLVGVRPPRRAARREPGRGWLVQDGNVAQCQFAHGDTGELTRQSA